MRQIDTRDRKMTFSVSWQGTQEEKGVQESETKKKRGSGTSERPSFPAEIHTAETASSYVLQLERYLKNEEMAEHV